VEIRSPTNQPITELELSSGATVDDLQLKFYKNFPRFYPSRQRFSVNLSGKKEVLVKGKALSEYGITPGKGTPCIIEFKDLGTQVSWKTVYLAEYIGPFLLYLFFYFQPEFIYGKSTGPSFYQRMACLCFLTHFGRRLFESAFVHLWSSESLGLFFLYKNCGYYWTFGALIGYFTNHPTWKPFLNDQLTYIAILLFVIFQVANMLIHLQLRLARSGKEQTYRWFPEGFFWTISAVSFPNYFFEVLIWISWNIAFFSIPGVLFLVAGTYQMAEWAAKKHSAYKKAFDGKDGRRQYPKHRKAMIPFLF